MRYFDTTDYSFLAAEASIFIEESDPVYAIDRVGASPCYALRATNRQLRDETLVVLPRIEPELDVMLVEDCGE